MRLAGFLSLALKNQCNLLTPSGLDLTSFFHLHIKQQILFPEGLEIPNTWEGIFQ